VEGDPSALQQLNERVQKLSLELERWKTNYQTEAEKATSQKALADKWTDEFQK
jgi:hypothetical protein